MAGPSDDKNLPFSRPRGPERFEDLLPAVAAVLDCSLDQARVLLARVDGMEGWVHLPSPGVRLLPVEHPSGDQCCVLGIDPGAVFPHHRHAHPEELLVLQGGYRNDDGTQRWRGDHTLHPVGSAHSVTALRGPGCLTLVRLRSP